MSGVALLVTKSEAGGCGGGEGVRRRGDAARAAAGAIKGLMFSVQTGEDGLRALLLISSPVSDRRFSRSSASRILFSVRRHSTILGLQHSLLTLLPLSDHP